MATKAEKTEKVLVKMLQEAAIELIKKGALINMDAKSVTIANYEALELAYNKVEVCKNWATSEQYLLVWDSYNDKVFTKTTEKVNVKTLL